MWGNPGVTELLQIQENTIQMPTTNGGQTTLTMQRAGLLRRIRGFFQSQINVSAYTNAPTKSVYGVLGAGIDRIRLDANGQIPLFDLSGLGLAIYNEIQNRDGSVLATPPYLGATQTNMSASANLARYDTVGATGDFYATEPFEVQLGLPFQLNGMLQEYGLWLLQNQAIDLTMTVNFNNPAQSAAGNGALWGGGVNTKLGVPSGSFINLERELYEIPTDPKNYPDLKWAHQIVEYTNTFTGSFSRYEIPRAGLLLRAIVINLDSSGLPVENTDVTSLKWVYGANSTPISRPGVMTNIEYLSDYNRLAPKGVQVLDFYKWGDDGLKLVKNTESLANLRLETQFATTTTGTQKIILDRLIPVANR